MRRGPKKGYTLCDLHETIRFLNMFKKEPKNVYQLYHSSLHFDNKKIYRYLRYTLKAELLEIDHIEEKKFMPPKYYRLTQKGKNLITVFKNPTMVHEKH